jgi:hypothetical protein
MRKKEQMQGDGVNECIKERNSVGTIVAKHSNQMK